MTPAEALAAIRPLPWVVYEHRGASWIKDAEGQWVGFTYSLAAAHLLVQIVNGVPADTGEAVALLRQWDEWWEDDSGVPAAYDLAVLTRALLARLPEEEGPRE